MLRTLCLALSLFAGSALACDTPSDSVRPLQVIGADAVHRLEAKDYAGLDRLVIEYRRPTALASDGQPKLIGFYDGLQSIGRSCDFVPDNKWQQRRQLLLGWQQASHDKLAPRLAVAALMNSWGWNARGGGYASEVTPEGWRLFKQRIAESQRQLEEMGSAGQEDPGWYAQMLSNGVAQGWTNRRFDDLYAEAVQKYPYYLQLYFIKGEFYSAKWHGSNEEFQKFVEESVKATAPLFGESIYARLHWSARSNTMFKDGETDWPRMRHGFERLLKDYPDLWNRNNFAKFACMAGDRVTLRRELILMHDRVISDAWNTTDYFNGCRDFAGL